MDTLAVSDHVRVRPGDKIPLDGEVIEGDAPADESRLTSEPIPVDKTGGGSLVVNSSLTLRRTYLGTDTALEQITCLVEEGQRACLSVQARGDRVTVVFVPAMLVVAALAFVAW